MPVPEAVTENDAVAGVVAVWLAGGTEMEGAVFTVTVPVLMVPADQQLPL